MSPENTVQDLVNIKQNSGYSGIPITSSGKIGGKLMGIVTSRDIDFMQEEMFDKRLDEARFRSTAFLAPNVALR